MKRVSKKPEKTYIWQQAQWPAFTVDHSVLAPSIHAARLELGRLLGQLETLGFDQTNEIKSELWVQDAVATSAIEGEQLNIRSVRSSVARRLGLSNDAVSNHDVDGLVDLLEDATMHHHQPLTHERLYRWQAALFAGSTIAGLAGIRRIAVGRYRTHTDAMQIVSGPIGKQTVHFSAPASVDVYAQMQAFLAWFETPKYIASAQPSGEATMGGLVRAAIAHLWFETIHPFEDGNGRVGRAIADLCLAQDVGAAVRVFSLSRQLLESRKEYYEKLNQAQCGGLDVTAWVQWFIRCYTDGCLRSQAVVRDALSKTRFWYEAKQQSINPRQRKVINRLLEAGDGGFLGGMTSEKYGKITGASKATATRDLTALASWGLLIVTGAGKGTRYAVNVQGWNAG